MKIYITKYALSRGIEEKETNETTGNTACYTDDRGWRQYYHGHGQGKEWHMTREAAIAHANEMVASKLESLKRQMAKLEAMKFE